MKRHFVACIALVLGLGAVANAQTQTNLQLILEGPFAVCEKTPGTLTVLVPNLQSTHYLAGFMGELDGFVPPDNKDDIVDYVAYPDNIDFAMNIQGPNGSTPMRQMKLMSQNSAATFYSEKADCKNPNPALTSFSLRVPDPDEVWPENPTVEKIYVHAHQDPSPIGPSGCNSTNGCNYATRIVLRYLDIDPATVSLIDLSPPKQKIVWTPIKNGAITESVGGVTVQELRIELSAEPVSGQDYETHARHAFRMASNVVGVQRDIEFVQKKDNGSDQAGRKTQSSVVVSNTKQHIPYIVTTHRVCQVPPLFVCSSNSTASACNQ